MLCLFDRKYLALHDHQTALYFPKAFKIFTIVLKKINNKKLKTLLPFIRKKMCMRLASIVVLTIKTIMMHNIKFICCCTAFTSISGGKYELKSILKALLQTLRSSMMLRSRANSEY